MFLFKSGKKENLFQLQNEGRIYMKPLSYLENCEDETRRDEFEKATFVINNPSQEYYLKVKEHGTNDEYVTVGMITNAIGKGFEGYIFCLHYLSLDDEIEKSVQISSKDDHILIMNSNLFLQVLKNKLDNDKIAYQYGLVTYKNFDNYVGNKTPFEKDLKYKNEYEFRLFIPLKENKEFYDFYIGNISKFSTLTKISPLSTFKIERRNSKDTKDVIHI